jgi:hypothetical protein
MSGERIPIANAGQLLVEAVGEVLTSLRSDASIATREKESQATTTEWSTERRR